MESYIVITAANLIRSIELRVAQMDQRQKTAGVGLYDKGIRTRLEQLKTMAALVAADKSAVVHLSCADAQLVAVFPNPVNSLATSRVPVRAGDININLKTNNPEDVIKAIRRSNRRLRS